jgi:micrococcal nuclease
VRGRDVGHSPNPGSVPRLDRPELAREGTCTPPTPRPKDVVYRFFLIIMLAVGVILGGCASQDIQTEGAGEQKKAEKVEAKNERPKEGEPRKQERPDPETQEKKATPQKPEAKKRSKEQASRPKPEPAPSSASTTSASASAKSATDATQDYDATVTVSRVVDGDTIEVSPTVNGNGEVRLIGMDTPETKDPSEEVEPLGPEASAFATDALTGKSVGLEFDVERKDQYGRLLAYVYLGGKMFNEVLIEEGLAQAYPYEPNTRYGGRFAAAQEEARAAGIGIWSLTLAQQCLLADRGNGIGEGTPGCSGATASPTASPSASASASASASPSAPSPAPSGGGTPSGGGDIDCDQVDGPIPTPPGDPDGLDGDGDGLSCE